MTAAFISLLWGTMSALAFGTFGTGEVRPWRFVVSAANGLTGRHMGERHEHIGHSPLSLGLAMELAAMRIIR